MKKNKKNKAMKCTKCNGKGVTPDRVEVAITFGFSYLIDRLMKSTIGWETCTLCEGKGFIRF